MKTHALRKNVWFPVIYLIFLACLMMFTVVCQWRKWWFPPPNLSETIIPSRLLVNTFNSSGSGCVATHVNQFQWNNAKL